MSDKETYNIKKCLNDEEEFDINNLEIVRVFLNFLPLGVLLGLYFRWKKFQNFYT